MRWVTQRRPKIDRLASPWLISRFVDPQAQFLFVAAGDVCNAAAATGGVPFDVPVGTPGADLVHPPGGTSFDAIRAKFSLNDPALDRIAAIVRDADNDNRFGLVPRSGRAAGHLSASPAPCAMTRSVSPTVSCFMMRFTSGCRRIPGKRRF